MKENKKEILFQNKEYVLMNTIIVTIIYSQKKTNA